MDEECHILTYDKPRVVCAYSSNHPSIPQLVMSTLFLRVRVSIAACGAIGRQWTTITYTTMHAILHMPLPSPELPDKHQHAILNTWLHSILLFGHASLWGSSQRTCLRAASVWSLGMVWGRVAKEHDMELGVFMRLWNDSYWWVLRESLWY